MLLLLHDVQAVVHSSGPRAKLVLIFMLQFIHLSGAGRRRRGGWPWEASGPCPAEWGAGMACPRWPQHSGLRGNLHRRFGRHARWAASIAAEGACGVGVAVGVIGLAALTGAVPLMSAVFVLGGFVVAFLPCRRRGKQYAASAKAATATTAPRAMYNPRLPEACCCGGGGIGVGVAGVTLASRIVPVESRPGRNFSVEHAVPIEPLGRGVACALGMAMCRTGDATVLAVAALRRC